MQPPRPERAHARDAAATDDALGPDARARALAVTPVLDHDHPRVAAFVDAAVAGAKTPIEQLVALYLRVRDSFRYTPWNVADRKEGFAASVVLGRSYEHGGHCIDKAVALVAGARYLGVPARLHFANVRNHIGTEELERKLGTDLLVFHGYAELWLGGRFVAATPAFNRQLCDKLGVEPLEFDGVHDSIFQAYDRQRGRFMEYVEDHGAFDDLPYELMVAQWRLHYRDFRATGHWPVPEHRA
jgi:transglutaminase-like putative cysteine protease